MLCNDSTHDIEMERKQPEIQGWTVRRTSVSTLKGSQVGAVHPEAADREARISSVKSLLLLVASPCHEQCSCPSTLSMLPSTKLVPQ